MVLRHEIFNKPIKITPTLVEENDEHKERNVQNWTIFNKTVDYDYGVVSSREKLEGMPDVEIIAGGLNSRADNGIALAREANMFQWGFSADPSYMTEEAKMFFVNVVCYMKKFDGHKVLIRSLVPKRSGVHSYASNVGGEYYSGDRLKTWFPEDLIEDFGEDKDKYVEYYKANENYIYVEEGSKIFRVDEDARKLGIANNKIELLDKCVALLKSGSDTKTAEKILKRYTQQKFKTAGEWEKWLQKNRDKLLFSDINGYNYIVVPGN
jgi:hypothetical protein